MTSPTSLLGCPPAQITTTTPAAYLRIAAGGGKAIVGVFDGERVRWAPLVVPAPLSLIADLEQVGYHRMWSGQPEVDLPTSTPLRAWLCDGDVQVLLLDTDPEGLPRLSLS